jgi:Protein of unknown function DUF45
LYLKEVNLKRSNTLGLESFINKVRINKPTLCENTILKLIDFIVSSGCRAIEFRKMSNRAMGISKTDVCILNYAVLKIPDEYFLYIILHEVAHQYQYRKHGKNLVLDVYLESTPLDEAARKLLNIEQTADRLAIAKLNSIMKLEKPIVSRYLGVTDLTQIKDYLRKIRSDVKELGLSTIEEINDCIQESIN